MATNPPTINIKNFPISLILANIATLLLSNYNCWENSIRFNSEFGQLSP